MDEWSYMGGILVSLVQSQKICTFFKTQGEIVKSPKKLILDLTGYRASLFFAKLSSAQLNPTPTQLVGLIGSRISWKPA